LPIVNDITHCQNTTVPALTAMGSNLLWYTTATGGTGSSTAPVPSTGMAGVFSFWVSQTISGCEGPRAKIDVTVNPAPFSTTLKDTSTCMRETRVLDAGPGFTSYTWNTSPPQYTQTITVSDIGTYSVTLTNSFGCSTIQSAKVYYGDSPVIKEIISGENYLTVFAEGGQPPYLYSIDNGANWQSSNRFDNLAYGLYTVYVKSKSGGCSYIVDTAVISVTNVITPNEDGYNDLWKIPHTELFPNAKLWIYNRFGEIIYQSEGKINSWDGKSNKRAVPSGTYWYVLKLTENSKRTGWILLKNRN
jgi:gliding motility-associated-like protein